jgi:hypothetical protein
LNFDILRRLELSPQSLIVGRAKIASRGEWNPLIRRDFSMFNGFLHSKVLSFKERRINVRM